MLSGIVVWNYEFERKVLMSNISFRVKEDDEKYIKE